MAIKFCLILLIKQRMSNSLRTLFPNGIGAQNAVVFFLQKRMEKANLFIVNGFLWRRANGRWVFPELNAKSFLFLCNFIFKGYTELSGYTEGPFLQHCGSYRVGYWGLDLLRCDVFNGLVIFETTFSKCQRSRQFPSGVLNAPELAP